MVVGGETARVPVRARTRAAGANAVESPADDDGGVEACVVETAREHGGGGGLAVGACHGKGGLSAGDVPQQGRTLDRGDARLCKVGHQGKVVGDDGGPNQTHTSIPTRKKRHAGG